MMVIILLYTIGLDLIVGKGCEKSPMSVILFGLGEEAGIAVVFKGKTNNPVAQNNTFKLQDSDGFESTWARQTRSSSDYANGKAGPKPHCWVGKVLSTAQPGLVPICKCIGGA